MDTDREVIAFHLDNAVMHSEAENDWAEGFWVGRAVEHAAQNAVDRDWLHDEFLDRGLDAAVIAVPKPGGQAASLN